MRFFRDFPRQKGEKDEVRRREREIKILVIYTSSLEKEKRLRRVLASSFFLCLSFSAFHLSFSLLLNFFSLVSSSLPLMMNESLGGGMER